MRCNIPWCVVDHVLFPINLPEKWQWILARLSFKDQCIYVYNSMGGAQHNQSVKKAVEPYAELIPHFLCSIDFWGSRTDGIPAAEALRICIVDGLPTQDNTDCGIFVAAFAEYLIEGNDPPKVSDDIDAIRSRYGVLLWDYGKKKQRKMQLAMISLRVD